MSKSVILPLSKSYKWGSIKIYCISLSEFGANVFRSLVERSVKTENYLSTFVVEGVFNSQIFEFH